MTRTESAWWLRGAERRETKKQALFFVRRRAFDDGISPPGRASGAICAHKRNYQAIRYNIRRASGLYAGHWSLLRAACITLGRLIGQD